MTKPGVAFLGTGLMGRPMATRLLAAGLLRAAWNRTRLDTRDSGTLPMADSIGQAVRAADVVCLCLTDSKAVEEVTFGACGVVAGFESGAAPLIIDFSTSSPAQTRSLAERYLAATGGAWLDAPVSGGVARAANGSLSAFCGGDPASFARARPILEVLTSKATCLGPVGSGQAAKLIAQLIAAPTLVAIAEAFATAEVMGLDTGALLDLYTGAMVDSPLLQIFGRRMVTRQTDPPIGAVGTMLKDIENAVHMAHSVGAAVPLGSEAAAVFKSVCERDGPSQEVSALIELYLRERTEKAAR